MASLTLRKRVYGFLLMAILVVVAVHFGGSYFLGGAKASADATSSVEDSQKDATPVELATATRGDISSFLSATANLRALRQVEVLSQAEGLVQSVSVEEGDSVKEGQVLCRLDSTDLEIRMQTAQQKLAQARLQMEKASIRTEKAETQISNSREELNRYQRLYDEKLVSEREVAQLRYRMDELLHDERVSSNETRELSHRVDELLAEISQVQLELDRTTVQAPFGGVITKRIVEKGQTIGRLDALFELSSLSTLFADVHLSEKETQLVQTAQDVSVAVGIDGSHTTRGRVSRISPVVDQSTGTVKVTVELDDSKGVFKPGAFVRVDIETETHQDTLLVPKRALLEEDGLHYVFVVGEDENVEKIPVELGFQTDGDVEIVAGLSESQRVVVAGQGALKDGSKIKVIPSEKIAG